jgi:GAF domain-containing protein
MEFPKVTDRTKHRSLKLKTQYMLIFFSLGLIISGLTYVLSRKFDSLISFLIIIPLVGIASWILGKFLAIPINAILTMTNQIINGNSSIKLILKTRSGEFLQLANNINLLSDKSSTAVSGDQDKIRAQELELLNARHQRQVEQYQAISAVARAIVSLQDPENILPQITKLIGDHFSYYHIGIFLLDKSNEFAILRATNSEGGYRMLKRGHRLKIGKIGIVGYVTATGEARIASDTGDDAVFFENPDLPNTRSEMALPLKIGQTVIGALDVQSTETNAFNQEDVAVLLTLADQIAVVIQNARLFEETRKSLADIETINRQYIQSAWKNLPKEKDLLGYQFNSSGASPIKNALKIDGTRIESEQISHLSIPIQLRGATIGTLKISNINKRDFTKDQIEIAKAVADRVAISLENARLLNETSRVAQRERTVGEISTKIRSVNDPQEMIKTALDELKQFLQVDQIRISPIGSKPPSIESDIENTLPATDLGFRTQ